MITASRPMTKQCPFVSETDRGTLTIACPDDAPELHELGRQTDKIAAAPITHEEFTRQAAALLPPGSVAEWETQTGVWSVKVREESPGTGTDAA